MNDLVWGKTKGLRKSEGQVRVGEIRTLFNFRGG